MLDPSDRTGLFEALRPPPGATLDIAVGTTFSLDLEAMLTAPIAFALFDAEQRPDDEVDVEPVGLLEAIRRHAGRTTVFFQAGQIAPIERHRAVFAWLEDAVVSVAAPRKGHLFHPKVWAIRFVTVDGQHVLRVLNATRNLTFDASWDTLLRIESDPYDPGDTHPNRNARPLAKLFRSLPEWATSGCSDERRAQVDSIAADLDRIHLHPPQPFESVQFHPLGFGGKRPEFPTNHRTVAVSPFLGPDALEDLGTVELLVSREEALERLPADALAKVKRVTTLSPAVDIDTDRPTPTSPDDDGPGNALAGLHAKLYIFQGHKTRLFTGSANLTHAGLNGNVEVLAELVTAKKHGINALLERTDGQVRFADLLTDWTPPAEPIVDEDADDLDRALGAARRAAATLGLHAMVTSDEGDHRLRVTSPAPLPNVDADVIEMSIHPATVPLSSQPIEPGQPIDATFNVSLEGITSFFVVAIRATIGEAEATTRFVVNATLGGAPADRHARLLASMLRDTQRLLRYLLLLLADEQQLADGALGGAGAVWFGKWGSASWDEVPLLEMLVRAVDRFPDRLDHIEQLLVDLGEHRDEVLPDGFEAIWEPVCSAAKAVR